MSSSSDIEGRDERRGLPHKAEEGEVKNEEKRGEPEAEGKETTEVPKSEAHKAAAVTGPSWADLVK